MSGKKLMVILLAVGLASFVGAFGVSYFFGKKPKAPTASTQPAKSELAQGEAKAGAGEQEPASPSAAKERQLDELAKDLTAQIAECKRQKAKLDEREKRLALAEEMLKKQAGELEALRVELTTPLASLKKALEDLSAGRVQISKLESANLKRTAQVFEKMESASSSKIITEMINAKQDDDAAKILRYMSDRAAAKLLSDIPDKAMVSRLSEKMKKIQEQL